MTTVEAEHKKYNMRSIAAIVLIYLGINVSVDGHTNFKEKAP